jgi:hypothetical protein
VEASNCGLRLETEELEERWKHIVHIIACMSVYHHKK